MTDLERIASDPLSRRQFLARMSAAGLGTAAVALLAGCGGGGGNGFSGNGGGGADPLASIPTKFKNGATMTSDQRVLSYALALETTEADIYRQALNLATQGVAQSALLRSSPSAYPISGRIAALGTGIPNSTLGDLAYLYLAQYAFVEAAHRDFILVALGNGVTADTPGQPTTANATNPVLNPAGYKFPAATDLTAIMTPILQAEETGVTAYLGAAPLLSSSATGLAYAQIATSIYSTEARHSAGVRYVFGYDIGPGNPTASGTVPSGPFISGSSQPASDVAANEFEYALDPQSVLTRVKAAFYN